MTAPFSKGAFRSGDSLCYVESLPCQMGDEGIAPFAVVCGRCKQHPSIILSLKIIFICGTTHRSFPVINKRAQLSDSVGAGLCSARVWLIPQLLKSGGVEPRPYRQRGFFRKARDICCVSARSIAPTECVSSRYITYAPSRHTGFHKRSVCLCA